MDKWSGYQTLESILAKAVSDHQTDWDLPQVIYLHTELPFMTQMASPLPHYIWPFPCTAIGYYDWDASTT